MDKKLTLGNVFDTIMCVENDVKREGKDLKTIEKVTRESARFSIEIITGLNRKEDFNSIMNNVIFDFFRNNVEKNNDSFIVRFLEKLELSIYFPSFLIYYQSTLIVFWSYSMLSPLRTIIIATQKIEVKTKKN